jgi:uncharacterized membrane protein YcaP (DUF421 family)
MWFENWPRILTLIVAGVGAYAALILTLRVSGKRTLAKLNAFDFVVTISLGSVLATVIVSRDVPLAEGVLALVLLVALQFVVAWISSRVPAARHVLTARPTALVVDGKLRPDALRRCRVTSDEVSAALRQQGIGSFAEVDAVVLETDGEVSVISDIGDGSALRDVSGISTRG